MKAGWEIIPFEKSIEKVKYTIKIAACDYCEHGEYPIISQEDEYISGYWNNYDDVFRISKPVVIFGDHTRVLKFVDFDFVLGADGVKILQPIDSINAKFFKFYLEFCNIPSLGYSRHYKLLKEVEVPVPPLPEQERIVSELDLISGVIDNKKQQLKELDSLAQSIFYEMFGNPVENEKGWEVMKLGDCFYHIKNGANIKQERGAQGIPITRIETLSGGVFNRDRLGYANVQSADKYASYILESGDLLLSHINSKTYIGRTVVYNKVGEEIIIHGMNLLRLKSYSEIIHPLYMQFYSFTDSFKIQIANRRKDAVNQSSISITDLKTISITIPPLPLQQEFASMIDSIEKQKELIKQSLQETETLFNSRMDFYFNS